MQFRLQGTVHVFKLATAEAKAAAARQLAAPGSDGNANPVSSLKFVSVSHQFLSILLSPTPAACMVYSRLPAAALCNNLRLLAVQSILPMPYFASERSFAQFRLSEEVTCVDYDH